MTYKTILVHCDAAKNVGHRLGVAAELAERHSAHLVGFHARQPFEAPVFFDGGKGLTQPSAHPRSMMACSIDLMPTASSFTFKVQAASQGAGQMRPVNSGKLLVLWSTVNAFCQSLLNTRSLKSGMMLLTGQPLLQNGVPQSMQRALCVFACSGLKPMTNSL